MKTGTKPVLLAVALLGACTLVPGTSSGTALSRNDARLSVVKYVYRTRWCGSTYFKFSLAPSQHSIVNGTVGAVNLMPVSVRLKSGRGVNPNRIKFDKMDATHPVMLHLLTCVSPRNVWPVQVVIGFTKNGNVTTGTLYPLKIKQAFWHTKVRQPWLIKKPLHQGPA